MSNRNPKDRENSNFKLPKIVQNHQSERVVTPHLHYLTGRTQKQEETTGQHSTRDPLLAYRSDTTRYEEFARNAFEQSRDRGLRTLSRIGRHFQRTCEEDLKRDKEMLNSILGRDTKTFNCQLGPSNSKSETSLFKTQPRSDEIIQDLHKDGFIATRRVGGLAFDVSLHGRPVRLSPIGAPDRRLSRNGCSKKRKKNQHHKYSAKRKKKEQKRKRRRKKKIIDSSDSDDGESRGSVAREGGEKKDEYKEEDWEDVEEEE